MAEPLTQASVLEAARQRCSNGCRNSMIGGRRATCLRCESAAELAWQLLKEDRAERRPPLELDASVRVEHQVDIYDDVKISSLDLCVDGSFESVTIGRGADRAEAMAKGRAILFAAIDKIDAGIIGERRS